MSLYNTILLCISQRHHQRSGNKKNIDRGKSEDGVPRMPVENLTTEFWLDRICIGSLVIRALREGDDSHEEERR